MRCPSRSRARCPLGLNRHDLARLAVPPRRLGELCATTCSQPSAMTSTAPTLGCAAVGGQRVVGHAHVGPELSAARQMRQRGADRRSGRGRHALRDDRRTDHGRHDEHVVARADAAVGPTIAVKTGTRSVIGSRAVLVDAVAFVRRLGERGCGSAGALRDRRDRACSPRCACARARRRDLDRRQPDRAAVLDHRLARVDRAQRDLVSGRDPRPHR